MTEYIIVEDSQEVYKLKISEEDINPLLESGFVSAIFRLNNGKIEFAKWNANVEYSWEEPKLKE